MTATLLPPEFSDLEPFAGTWCLATESERRERRMSSTMPQLQAFYDAGSPRLRDALDHCAGSPVTLFTSPRPLVGGEPGHPARYDSCPLSHE